MSEYLAIAEIYSMKPQTELQYILSKSINQLPFEVFFDSGRQFVRFYWISTNSIVYIRYTAKQQWQTLLNSKLFNFNERNCIYRSICPECEEDYMFIIEFELNRQI